VDFTAGNNNYYRYRDNFAPIRYYEEKNVRARFKSVRVNTISERLFLIWKYREKKPTALTMTFLILVMIIVIHLFNFPNSIKGDVPFSENVKVNDDTNIADQNKPSIAVDSNGMVYAVWEDKRRGDWDIYFARSEDEGLTWTDPNIRLSTDDTNKTQSAPAIAVSSKGNIYVVWQDDRDGDFDIYFTKSVDGGDTWTDPNIKISKGSGSQSAPAIALDSEGVIYVVWEDYRWGDYDIYLTKSEDGGEKWLSENKRVNTDGAGSTQLNPTIAIDSSNIIYVAWEHQVTFDNYDIVCGKSTDGGGNWTLGLRVNDVIIKIQGNPSISAGSAGNVYLAWQDNRGVDYDIYFAKSNDEGSTWSSPNVKVNDASAGDQQNPSLALGSSGTIYAVWQDKRSLSNWDVYFAYSINEGLNWTDPNIRVDDDTTLRTQALPTIAVGPRGPVYVAWEDYRNSNDDIYCANMEAIHPYPIADELKVEGYPEETSGIMHIIPHTPTFSFIYKDPSSNPLSQYNVSVWDEGAITLLWWSNRSYSIASGSEVTINYNTEPHPTTGPPLIDGISYLIKVSVANITGNWGPFSEVEFHMNQVLAPIPPISPLDKSLIIASTTQIVSWTSPGSDAEGDFPVGYIWEVATDSGFENIIESSFGLVLESEAFDTTPSGYFYWRVKLSEGWETGSYGNQPDSYWVFSTYTPGLNNPPTITNKENSPTKALVNSTLTFTFNATDPDSDLLTWGKISGPNWLYIGQTNGTIYGTPLIANLGSNAFTIQVSDGKGGTDNHTFTIIVESDADGDGQDDQDENDDIFDLSKPSFPCLILIVVIIVVIIIIFILLFLRKKRAEEEMKSSEGSIPSVEKVENAKEAGSVDEIESNEKPMPASDKMEDIKKRF
jgi:hypothetical protein